MQRSRHAVRYYIDRNDDGAEVRSVPVTIHAAERPEPARQANTPVQSDDAGTPTPTRRAAKSAHVSTLVRSAVRRAPRRSR